MEVQVGDIVRRLRDAQNLSLRALAARTGFSASFLSQVELGQASPSIASLERIAGALGITLAQFFDGVGPAPAIVRARTRVPLTSGWSKARIEGLAGHSGSGTLGAVLVTIAPGGRSGKHPAPATAEEFAMVLAGRVQLTLGEETHVLGSGDAVTIVPEVSRLWLNPYRTSARVLRVSGR